MAGSGSEDNPLPVNVVPMVDVIFCLCVFFLASFHTRPQESRLDTWLPKDRGTGAGALETPAELRVLLGWEPATGAITRRLGQRDLRSLDELGALLRAAQEAQRARNQPPRPLIVDAQQGLPWAAAVEVVDLARELGIGELQFAQGPP